MPGQSWTNSNLDSNLYIGQPDSPDEVKDSPGTD